MSRGRAAAGVLAAVLGLAALALFSGPAGEPVVPGSAAQRAVAGEAAAESGSVFRAAERRPLSTGAELPPSLRGTEVAGALRTDAAGHFVPDRAAFELFEYYLSATGEVAEGELRERIVFEIEARLVPPAVAEAIAFLDRTLAYRSAARSLFESAAFPASLERRFQRIRELRREFFGAEVAAVLFGTEEDALRVDLEARRVARDGSLGDVERAERLAALEQQLPPEVRDSRRRSRAALDFRAEEEALRDAGAGEGELWALREERFGADAAERLAELDRARASWDARLAAYREARAALLADAPGDEAALDALRAKHFTGPEWLRVEALDRVEGG
ncbi:MAG: lipase chaperone [Myxococcales bacterium]|nr:lipase chaperone [Myxococcales bacterium]